MAMNIKGKKTSLDEQASIYEKRDEEESEKSKWSRMDQEQRKTHFKTYYLRSLIIGVLVLCIVGFFIYKDVITKKDVIYYCAILNEQAFDIPLTEFGEGYVEHLGLDPDRQLSSFHLFYTDGELARAAGASASSDLTQVSSMVFAKKLDSLIAGQNDYDTYRQESIMMDLSELLSEEELAVLQDDLYVPETDNEAGHPYGVYLDQSPVYETIFRDGGGIVEKPIFGVVFNSEKKEESRQFLYYVFPELAEASGSGN
ncbi:MAG: hypothetical protein NC293_09655 [Roseburia sp.]|nr:hypothetical protein [Roseburia sp.]